MWRTSSAVLSVLLLAACGGSTGPGTTPTPTVTSIEPREQGLATLYVVGDTPRGLRLFPEVRTIAIVGNDLAADALRALLDGGLEASDPDHVSLWSDADTSLRALTRDGAAATVDLAYGRLNVGAEAEARAIDQLVWTAVTADPSIRSVRITVDGAPIESLAGHVDASQPFVPGDGFDVLAAIVILSPAEGEAVTGGVVIEGEACTFEANVAWRMLRDGVEVDTGAVTAAEACPVRSPWSLDLGALEPGSYVVVASEFSAEDGSLVVEDSRAFTVVEG